MKKKERVILLSTFDTSFFVQEELNVSWNKIILSIPTTAQRHYVGRVNKIK